MTDPSCPPPASSNETGVVGDRRMWGADVSPTVAYWFYTLVDLCTWTLSAHSYHLTLNRVYLTGRLS